MYDLQSDLQACKKGIETMRIMRFRNIFTIVVLALFIYPCNNVELFFLLPCLASWRYAANQAQQYGAGRRVGEGKGGRVGDRMVYR